MYLFVFVLTFLLKMFWIIFYQSVYMAKVNTLMKNSTFEFELCCFFNITNNYQGIENWKKNNNKMFSLLMEREHFVKIILLYQEWGTSGTDIRNSDLSWKRFQESVLWLFENSVQWIANDAFGSKTSTSVLIEWFTMDPWKLIREKCNWIHFNMNKNCFFFFYRITLDLL